MLTVSCNRHYIKSHQSVSCNISISKCNESLVANRRNSCSSLGSSVRVSVGSVHCVYEELQVSQTVYDGSHFPDIGLNGAMVVTFQIFI